MYPIIGNRGVGRTGLTSGGGTPRRPSPFGHLTVSGKSGDIVRIVAADYFPVAFQIGMYAQASAGSVKIEATLADPELAVNPDQDAGDHWVADITAAPGSIKKLTADVATALKLTFNADAICYLVAV